jgi:hypothetical protein
MPVTTTEYVPSIAVDPEFNMGFWIVEVKLFGPLHTNPAAGSITFAFNIRSFPSQRGELEFNDIIGGKPTTTVKALELTVAGFAHAFVEVIVTVT